MRENEKFVSVAPTYVYFVEVYIKNRADLKLNPPHGANAQN